ncbi:oxysterol-binding protein-related protein 7 isoform X1 [Sardina pilchardus]|uniref:oxysterol-binding protein-related protein 7 isoform X1 n=2 Tax=Sardina pilchardus TaxID=27697 RepID=UPI002E136521
MDPYGPTLDRSQSVMSGLERSNVGWHKPAHSRSSSTASSRHSRPNIKDWEIMDDLQMDVGTGESLQDLSMPGICEGYLMKRRKWPLKGWHKRYFVLDKGILRYSRTQQDFSKGKLGGSLDVSFAVISINKKSKRIDLDAGDNLYHIKAKSHDMFYIWVTKLNAHRVFKKNEAANVQNGFLQALSQGTSGMAAHRNGATQDMVSVMSTSGSYMGEMTPQASELPISNSGVNGKVSEWLQQTEDHNSCAQELNRVQMDISELSRLIQKLHAMESGPALNNGELQRIISVQNLSLEKPKKRSAKMWGHSRTLSRVEALGMLSSSQLQSASHLGTSVPSIPDYVYSQLAPPTVISPEGKKLHVDICAVSSRVHNSLKTVHESLAQERQRLQEAYNNGELPAGSQPMATLLELETLSLMTQIYSVSASSESSDSSEESFRTVRPYTSVRRRKPGSSRRASQRPPSVADSTAEYFDASDDLLCSSSDGSEEASGLSDGTSNSEPEEGHESATRKYRASLSKAPAKASIVPQSVGYRTSLPAICPDNSHIGLMSILYNNIGKDLSRISMPAALNEPINLLQRLCEELEYSELLDTASNTEDPYERMVYIAAFAISGYSIATYRNRYKPFNPVLGETYECVRDDRKFRFISEQVSHHPPVSACHAESDTFAFWQDQRWKNKFWGKSVEIMPAGMVNVTLPKRGDHYEWNKVVTCIHNVLTQQRYLEHYGEVTIRNLKSSVCTCKITFVKSRYWGSDANRNEVQGQVLNQSGKVVHRFGGLWHEGIFCDTLPTPQCLWKPTPMPKDQLLYFGFTAFALELNELTPDLKPLLPPTDTRLRPDQRFLEEGRIEDTDRVKDEIEDRQRERRKELSLRGEDHVPRFFRKTVDAAGREIWVTNGSYWKQRENPGFANIKNVELW